MTSFRQRSPALPASRNNNAALFRLTPRRSVPSRIINLLFEIYALMNVSSVTVRRAARSSVILAAVQLDSSRLQQLLMYRSGRTVPLRM